MAKKRQRKRSQKGKNDGTAAASAEAAAAEAETADADVAAPAADGGIAESAVADDSFWPAADMQKFSYLIFFFAAVFLVNALEPGRKGETGVVGVVCLVLAAVLFGIARSRQGSDAPG
jgi:hypothetical protein